MKLPSVLAVLIVSSATLFAADISLRQSTKEIGTILSDPQLLSSLPANEPVLGVKRLSKKHTYHVLTSKHFLSVDVEYKNPKKPEGPFTLHFHAIKPIDQIVLDGA